MTDSEIAARYFELSNASDLDAIHTLLTDNTTYSSVNTGLFLGVEAIMEMQEGFHDAFLRLEWEVTSMAEEKPGIFRFDYLFRGVEKSGGEVEEPGVEYVIVHEGKIRHIEIRGRSAV